jgi:hypothetical protein
MSLSYEHFCRSRLRLLIHLLHDLLGIIWNNFNPRFRALLLHGVLNLVWFSEHNLIRSALLVHLMRCSIKALPLILYNSAHFGGQHWVCRIDLLAEQCIIFANLVSYFSAADFILV